MGEAKKPDFGWPDWLTTLVILLVTAGSVLTSDGSRVYPVLLLVACGYGIWLKWRLHKAETPAGAGLRSGFALLRLDVAHRCFDWLWVNILLLLAKSDGDLSDAGKTAILDSCDAEWGNDTLDRARLRLTEARYEPRALDELPALVREFHDAFNDEVCRALADSAYRLVGCDGPPTVAGLRAARELARNLGLSPEERLDLELAYKYAGQSESEMRFEWPAVAILARVAADGEHVGASAQRRILDFFRTVLRCDEARLEQARRLLDDAMRVRADLPALVRECRDRFADSTCRILADQAFQLIQRRDTRPENKRRLAQKVAKGLGIPKKEFDTLAARNGWGE